MAETKQLPHTVYFVRHGQCVGNVSGEILKPELDVITDYGRKQAALLGDALKDVHFTSAVASTYQRAIETAKGILSKSTEAFPNEELKMDARIQERDMGDFIGLRGTDVLQNIFMSQLLMGKKLGELEVPGGEPVSHYVDRIRSFFQDLFEELRAADSPQAILIVSHGLTMRHFLKGLADIFSDVCDVTNWDRKCLGAIKNTALTQFTVEFHASTGKPFIHFQKINDTEHLSSLEEEGEKKEKTSGVSEEQKQMIRKICEIPGAREEISACVQV